jgi:hypothetical protein
VGSALIPSSTSQRISRYEFWGDINIQTIAGVYIDPCRGRSVG